MNPTFVLATLLVLALSHPLQADQMAKADPFLEASSATTLSPALAPVEPAQMSKLMERSLEQVPLTTMRNCLDDVVGGGDLLLKRQIDPLILEEFTTIVPTSEVATEIAAEVSKLSERDTTSEQQVNESTTLVPDVELSKVAARDVEVTTTVPASLALVETDSEVTTPAVVE